MPTWLTRWRRMRRQSRAYKVIGWNVHIRNSVSNVRKGLEAMIDRWHPEVIVLEEAARCYGHLDGLGYRVIQSRPHRAAHGVDESANIAILVRDDLDVRDERVMRMRVRWDGPVHGWPHPPRQYQRVVVTDHGRRVMAVLGVHLPFGAAAQAEALGRIGTWLAAGTGAHPRIAVGDWNRSKHRVRRAMKKHSRSIKVVGAGVDLMAARNVRPVRAKRLGKHDSDHHAMLHRFGDPKPKKHKKKQKKKGGR